MQISTLLFQIKEMVGFKKVKKADELIFDELSDTFEPSTQSIKNIMAFSSAYHYDKSDAIGDIEYLIN
ncbi:MAG: hypothetical protein PF517_20430 [Salinivirgaceae bacterium]|jgi:hypothetical protein|nr:hypothetical protein [Salinivirgaceae bacterium]